MTEVYTVDIGTGNSLKNKVALVLNQAGDSPKNPILRGLGLSIDMKFTSNVTFFEAKFGMSTPPDDRILTFTEIDDYHYRLTAAAGYGNFGFSVDYEDPQRHFLSLQMTGPSHVVSTEREVWIQEDPLIELGFCAGSAVQSAWLASVSEAYFFNDATQNYGLTFDPGSPETIGVSMSSSDSPHYIEASDDRDPIELAIYDVNQVYPLDIPLRLMDNWRDEFNQKHYGGAKYVSIFEEGEAEDHPGTYIVGQYQADIDTLTSFQVRNADTDHEYRLTFRFRSELNDTYYVDKTITFRLLTADILNRDFGDDIYESDLPDIVYSESEDAYYWDGMDAAVTEFGFTSVFARLGDELVALPTDDSTAFNANWLTIWAVVYGGEIPVTFQRTASGTQVENVVETYRAYRPSGAATSPVTFSKRLFKRFIHSNYIEWSPEVQFRLIEPEQNTGTGATSTPEVFVEFINNRTVYKQVAFMTEKGSVNVSLPVRNGQRHAISSILTFDDNGAILDDQLAVMLQTENTLKIVRTGPVPKAPRMRSSDPGTGEGATGTGTGDIGDGVTPTISVSYPDVTIDFPATTDDGETYSVEMGESGSFNQSILLFGRKGAYRVTDNTLAPGSSTTVTQGVSECANPTNAVFFIHFRIKYTSGPNNGEFQDFVWEIPTYGGYSGTPDSGAHPGEMQVIFYDGKLIIVSKPTNLHQFLISGNLGLEFFDPGNMLDDHWYDISHLASPASASIDLGYYTVDSSGFITYHGPYIVPRFVPQSTTVDYQATVQGSAWVTGRLTSTEAQLPLGKVNYADQTIEFDYTSRYTEWVRFSVTNPHDSTEQIFNARPQNFIEYDISRLFKEKDIYELQPGQRIAVTFLHTCGAHVVGLYEISGDWEEPKYLNQLRGEL